MFDAGSAVVTLTGRVVREPFESYGRLVDVARSEKEHRINLGAVTDTLGFDKFQLALDKLKQSSRDFVATAKASFDGVVSSTNKMAVGADRDLGVVRGALDKTARSFGLIDDSAKATASSSTGAFARMQKSVIRTADEYKVAADGIVRSNEKIAESTHLAAGGGGRRGGGAVIPTGGGGPFGHGQEQQAKRTTAAWKEGANTLAGLGKWTTIIGGGLGIISVKWAADFGRQMELIRTQVGYTDKQVNSLRKSVLDLAPTVGVGPDELAKGLYHVTSVLQGRGGTNEAMRILKLAAEGAKVGMANMEDVSSALMAIYKSGPRDIHSVSEAMGVMNDIVGQGNLRMEDLSKALTTGVLAAAKNAHLGLRDLGAALDTMTSRGIPAEQAATRLRTTLTLMSSPTGKAEQALGKLGMSSTRLAEDMQKHGLVYALQDLQNHLDKTFPPGRPLTIDQEREAMMRYGKQLEASGVSGKALEKDLAKFKHQLQDTGSSAVQQSQLITSAFGGSRMGTTMALLLQNASDVRSRFDSLNKANAAGRFQKAWEETKKEFSTQVNQMWAGIQKLGIQLGDFLIPKIKATVNWLIEAGHWLGRHKVLAEALAITFGTVLTAAVVAFFGRFLIRTAEGLKAMGQFGKYIAVDLPKQAGSGFKWLLGQLGLVKTSAEETSGAVQGIGAGLPGGSGAGGPGGVAGEVAGGEMLGMIEGVIGAAAPGSKANPLAVVVLASEMFGMGAQGAAAEAETAGMAESRVAQAEGQMALPGMGRFGKMGGTGEQMMLPGMAPAAETAVMAEAGAAPAVVAGESAGLMSRVGGAIMPGLMGLGMGAMAQSAAGLRGGAVGTLGGGAVGAAIGTLIAPGIGTAIGAGLGSALGPTVGHFLNSVFGGGSSVGQRAAATVTRGVRGNIAAPITGDVRSVGDVRSAIQRNIDQATQATRTNVVGGRFGGTIQKPSQAELDRARNDYQQAGLLSGQAFIAGYQHVQDKSGASLVVDFKAKMKDLPNAMGGIAKNAAASQMLEYAAGLEANKQLPKGETQKIIKELEAYYPGLRKYLRDQAESTDAELATVFELKSSRSTLQDSIKFMENQFGYMPKNAHVTLANMTQEFSGGLKYLKQVIDTSTGQQRDDAIAAYKQLQQQADHYLKLMETRTAQHMTNISDEIKHGSTTAVNQVIPYWNEYASIVANAEAAGLISVKTGNQMLARELDKALQALGLTSHQAQNLAKAGYTVQDVRNLQVGARGSALAHLGATAQGHEGGGFLPGREYGFHDAMTLVDPQGRPRARMAGDEAVFNRHQMPFVDMGLRALGFNGAEELWQKVNTPHGAGYEKGGYLPAFFGGGQVSSPRGANGPYSGYALPLPIQYMRLPWSPDQGIDIPAPAHTPEYAIGPGVIMSEGIQGFGPWAPILKVTAGPLAGDQFYYGHAGPNFVHRGAHVRAGQAITQVGAGIVGISTGPHIEFGFWPPRGGVQTAAFLHALEAGAGVAQFGGGAAGGAATWTDLRVPRIKGSGALVQAGQGVLDQITKGVNQFGQSQIGGMSGAGWGGGGNNVQNEALGRKMMLASPWGWGANQWPYLKMLWSKESSWQTRIANPTSGAYGIPQSLPADKMATAGHDWRTNPATQIAWGLNYIHGTYGTPQAAWGHEVSHNWYNRGGWLGHFQGGGRNPWAPLSSGTRHLPGFRPPRVRRGTRGLHTVGGGHGGSHGLTGGTRSGRHGSTHVGNKRTTRIGITQKVADVLTALGFGDLANLDNKLGNLDTKYTNQENLFNMFSDPSIGLSQDQLNTLMGIREQQWDLAFKAYNELPGIQSSLQRDVDALMGHTIPGHHERVRTHGHHGHHAHDRHGRRIWVGPRTVGGVVPDITASVTNTEDEITKLEHELQIDSQKIAGIHHTVTGDAMALADHYARALAGYTDQVNSLNDQKYKNSQERINLQAQLRNATSSSASSLTLQQIVSGVWSGALPAAGSTSANPTKIRLRNQIAELHGNDLTITGRERHIRTTMHDLVQKKEAATRNLRQQGFDAAWAITLKKYRIQDKIFSLRQTLKKLKASLKLEEAAGKDDTSALQTVTNAVTGGLQGGQSLKDTVGSIGQNILDLYQQGAKLPTPPPSNRRTPTLSSITDFLSTVMGLTLPPGLASGQTVASAAATAAYNEFLNFQASRESLFSQFGGNFVGAGVNPLASSAGIGAGVQFFGAAAGPSAGAGAPGGTPFQGGGWLRGGGPPPGPGNTTISIEQNFAAGPPDPHTWASGVTHELQAQV